MNLANQLVINYNNRPNKICLIQNNKKITYDDLYKKVSNFKKYIEQKGIKKGDKVLVLTPMSIDLYVTLLSVWAIGATVCFMDAGFIKNGMKKNEFDDINAVIGISKYILYSNINKNLRGLRIKINTSIIEKLHEDNKLVMYRYEQN